MSGWYLFFFFSSKINFFLMSGSDYIYAVPVLFCFFACSVSTKHWVSSLAFPHVCGVLWPCSSPLAITWSPPCPVGTSNIPLLISCIFESLDLDRTLQCSSGDWDEQVGEWNCLASLVISGVLCQNLWVCSLRGSPGQERLIRGSTWGSPVTSLLSNRWGHYSRRSLECLGKENSSQQSCPVLSTTHTEWVVISVQCLLGDEEDSSDLCGLSLGILIVDYMLEDPVSED